jgi:hypothetical protein
VIVGEHEAGTPMSCRIGDDLADREQCSSIVPAIAGEVQAVCLVIEMRDRQAFPPWVLFGKAACEERSRVG